jgi:2-oxoglutarate ferredoxin oxidoreductase subunit alpha
VCTVVAWYPITPSTSVVEATIEYLKKFRVDRRGKATFAVVQAEDELAAIGMVLGALAGPARVDDCDLRPWHLADGGVLRPRLLRRDSRRHLRRAAHRPFDGHADAHSQADLLSTAFLSHGDTKHVVLLPGSVKECFEFGYGGLRSGRAVADAGLRALRSRSGHEQLDVRAVSPIREAAGSRQGADAEDLIGWAALPAIRMWTATASAIARCPAPIIPRRRTSRAAPDTTRRRLHRAPDDYELMERLARKFETARKLVPRPVVVQTASRRSASSPYGTSHFAITRAAIRLKKEYGFDVDYLRMRAIRSRARCMSLSLRTSASTWSSRIAMRRC